MKTYALSSVTIRETITSTLDDAIERALALEEHYQPAYGIEIWCDGDLIAHVIDGAATLEG